MKYKVNKKVILESGVPIAPYGGKLLIKDINKIKNTIEETDLFQDITIGLQRELLKRQIRGQKIEKQTQEYIKQHKHQEITESLIDFKKKYLGTADFHRVSNSLRDRNQKDLVGANNHRGTTDVLNGQVKHMEGTDKSNQHNPNNIKTLNESIILESKFGHVSGKLKNINRITQAELDRKQREEYQKRKMSQKGSKSMYQIYATSDTPHLKPGHRFIAVEQNTRLDKGPKSFLFNKS